MMSKNHSSHHQELSSALSSFDGDTASYRRIFDAIAQQIPFAQSLLVTTFPRGGTQILQPSHVPDAFLRAYSKGLFTDDGPTWQAVLRETPVTGKDCVASGALDAGAYFKRLMEPNGFAHVAAVRVPGPVLKGYPGAIHLYRKAGEAAFTADEMKKLGSIASQLGPLIESNRNSRSQNSCGAPAPWEHYNDIHRQFIFDRHGKQVSIYAKKPVLDDQLKQEMKKLVSSQLANVNDHSFWSDRVDLFDSNGELWAFRTAVHKEFPALGDGPYVFLCIQPPACEWNALRQSDFQADPEVSRLIPAIKFMQAEFRRVPTLNEIASKAHLSPFHFHRRFTELLGMTPKFYLLCCQITLCKKMLIERKVVLADIAAECGFAHQSHFTSRFKQAAGLTPTRWRRFATDHLMGGADRA
jgi:AraC-like DNA-binding protein